MHAPKISRCMSRGPLLIPIKADYTIQIVCAIVTQAYQNDCLRHYLFISCSQPMVMAKGDAREAGFQDGGCFS